MTLEVSRKIFEKFFNIKFYKSPSMQPSSSMRTDRQRDMTKLTVAFRNFTNVPYNDFVKILSVLNKYSGELTKLMG